MAATQIRDQQLKPLAKALVTLTSDTALTANTPVKLVFNSEVFDIGSNFDTTNRRFVAPENGYYNVYGAVHVYGGTSYTGLCTIWIYKNNSAVCSQAFYGATTGGRGGQILGLLHLNATDYVEIFVQTGEANWLAYAEPTYTRFSIEQISAD